MRASRYTDELIAIRDEALAHGNFKGFSPSGKIHCVVDGDAGFPGGSWMDNHIAGHSACPDCGQMKPTRTMAQHRAHHRRSR